LQGTLALAGLCAAYFTWQRGVELAPGEVFVVDSNKNDLSQVRFEDEDTNAKDAAKDAAKPPKPTQPAWVELVRTSDENGSFVQVHLSAQEKPAPGKDLPPIKTPERLVRGSDAADKLFASFAPWRASRGLGILEPARLKDLGLDAPKKHITLTLRNGKRIFAIAPAPPGGSDPYLRDEASGQVYVVSRSFLSDFQTAASLLVERHLHGFKVEEADRVSIQRGAKKKDFLVSRGEDGVRLSPLAAPDKPDTTAKTWHDRAFGLWPMDMLGKDETPAEGTPQLDLRIDYSVRGRRLGFLELAKVPAVATGSEGAKDTLFARSERTLGWFKLGADAQSVLTDADGLLR
jgi:hypothetical protein